MHTLLRIDCRTTGMPSRHHEATKAHFDNESKHALSLSLFIIELYKVHTRYIRVSVACDA